MAFMNPFGGGMAEQPRRKKNPFGEMPGSPQAPANPAGASPSPAQPKPTETVAQFTPPGATQPPAAPKVPSAAPQPAAPAPIAPPPAPVAPPPAPAAPAAPQPAKPAWATINAYQSTDPALHQAIGFDPAKDWQRWTSLLSQYPEYQAKATAGQSNMSIPDPEGDFPTGYAGPTGGNPPPPQPGQGATGSGGAGGSGANKPAPPQITIGAGPKVPTLGDVPDPYGTGSLRSRYIAGNADDPFVNQVDPRLAQARLDTEGFRGQIAGGSYAPFQSVRATDASGASDLNGEAGQAFRALGGWNQGYDALDPASTKDPRALIGEATNMARGSGLSDFQSVAAGNPFDPASDTAKVRGRIGQGVDSLYDSPDRMALVKEGLSQFDQSESPFFKAALREATGNAAAGGGIGSGMLNSRLGDVASEFQNRRNLLGQQLIADASQRTLDDRLGRLSATQSAAGDLFGLDTGTSAQNMAIRNERRGERNAQRTDEYDKAGLGLTRSGALRDTAGDLYGLNRGEYGDRASERDFQFGVDRTNADLTLEKGRALQGLSGQQFGQGMGLRNEARGEADRRLGYDDRLTNFRRASLDALSGEESRLSDLGMQARDELRGERAFQTGQARQAVDDRLRQYGLQRDATESDRSFAMSLASLGLSNDQIQAAINAQKLRQGVSGNPFGG